MIGPNATIQSRTASAVLELYRPIIRGYFAVFASYYLVLLPTNFWYYTGVELGIVASVGLLTSMIGIFGFWCLRKKVLQKTVESMVVVLNCLVVCNVVIALSFDFAPAKLVYFVIMVMLFALASISMRQSVLSIVFATLAFCTFLPKLGFADLVVHGFLVFGATIASLSITYYLRKAITSIAAAKLDAEGQLEEARIVGENLRKKSLSDSLTGLPNRRAFFESLRKAKFETGSDENIWLVLVDLDGFKSVNDVHGHLVGDLLLKQVADRLRGHCADQAHVSRMGGDEFNMILVSAAADETIKAWSERLLGSLAEPYVIEGRYVRISGSLGCKKMDLSLGARSQISEADYALMVAKRQGKNRAVIFNERHARESQERYRVERALQTANLSEEIELVFQPQVHLGSNRITRAEALARWSNPEVGNIEPRRFIKAAEESGLITNITITVVSKAFAELKSWPNPVPIAINLSAHDVITDPIIEQITSLAQEREIDPAMIEFEVTESAMMADMEKATANLDKLAGMGFSIALDDFGTGYSNFNYLRRLPISKLKVDRSFMENPGDPMTEKMLRSLASMAHTLGVTCLLEGVEDEVDLVVAKRVGVDAVQGFLFGRPMASNHLIKLVEENALPSTKVA